MCPRSKSGELQCPLDPTLNTWIIKESGFTEGKHNIMWCKSRMDSAEETRAKPTRHLYGHCNYLSLCTIGNAEQWRWFVPHDIPGLVRLFKSKSSFINHLTEFFEESMKHPSNFLPNPYYW